MEPKPENVTRSALQALLPALRALDELLDDAVTKSQAQFGGDALSDPYRGLYVGEAEVVDLLQREPGGAAFQGNNSLGAAIRQCEQLANLQLQFGLSAFDLAMVVIALAREVDLRYERIYSYLQDDVTRRLPTVDLTLNLLCESAAEKSARREHFAADAPLQRNGLMRLVPDPSQVQPPLLAHYIALEDQTVRMLLGQRGLDRRVAEMCKLEHGSVALVDLNTSPEIEHGIAQLVQEARNSALPLNLYFYGLSAQVRRNVALALAHDLNAPLLEVSVPAVLAAKDNVEGNLALLLREAQFQNAIAYLDAFDGEIPDAAFRALARHRGVVVLSGRAAWVPLGRNDVTVIPVNFPMSDFVQRRDCWEGNLHARNVAVDADAVDALADRFRLTPERIGEAVAMACDVARQRSASQPGRDSSSSPTTADLFAMARGESAHDLTTLARKVLPAYGWDDIVLPPATVLQLHEICQWVEQRHRVLGTWGFDRKLSLGKGVTALFVGPSGVGKTMAAEVVARELQLELYKIDLSSVVSKYLGETEKNLDKIFSAAENANAILFFDEADALFGKRSEVRDSHDRYANIEISYLLQKMEQYEGIAILATNLRNNMDDAFVRRLQFIVEFTFPDEQLRKQIWQVLFPPEAPREDHIDYATLAKLRLAGGNIKNVVLGAAFLAAADAGRIGMKHLVHATQREYEKLGKPLSAPELAQYAEQPALSA